MALLLCMLGEMLSICPHISFSYDLLKYLKRTGIVTYIMSGGHIMLEGIVSMHRRPLVISINVSAWSLSTLGTRIQMSQIVINLCHQCA